MFLRSSLERCVSFTEDPFFARASQPAIQARLLFERAKGKAKASSKGGARLADNNSKSRRAQCIYKGHTVSVHLRTICCLSVCCSLAAAPSRVLAAFWLALACLYSKPCLFPQFVILAITLIHHFISLIVIGTRLW